MGIPTVVSMVSSGGRLFSIEDRATPELPATGDWVTIRDRPGLGWRLEAILPRRSAVSRLNAAANGEQVLAANLDIIFALHGVDRPHRVGRLERLIPQEEEFVAQPVAVMFACSRSYVLL